MQEKMKDMSDEERQAFIAEMRKKRGSKGPRGGEGKGENEGSAT